MAFDLSMFDPTTIVGAGIGAGLIALGIFIVLILVALYVYFAFAWMTIAKKMKHKRPWLAWIPFANISLWLQLGGFHWAWVFLIVIPYAGTIAVGVLGIISHWRVFNKLKYPEWLSLVLVLSFIPVVGFIGTLAYAIIIGIVAWNK